MSSVSYDFNLPVLELKNGELRVSPWALTVKEFRSIYEADDRSDKRVAAATLLYIALREDYALWDIKMDDAKQHIYALEHCGMLRLKKQWKPNNHIYTAMERYREIQMSFSVEMQLLFATEVAIKSLSKNIIRIARESDKLFSRKKLDTTDAKLLESLIEGLLEYTPKLADKINNVHHQRELICKKRRHEKKQRIRGEGELGIFSEPEDSVLNKDKEKLVADQEDIKVG